MTTPTEQKTICRATGLLVIEVRNANPNGNPDSESDPRQRPDGRGEISPVSFKRKLRDLIEDRTVVWQEISRTLGLDDDSFHILESRNRGFGDVQDTSEAWKEVVKLAATDGGKALAQRYWDARVFGSTFLEKGESGNSEESATTKQRSYIRTGVVQFGIGVSLAPIEINRATWTKKAPAEESKDRGMAPLASRTVAHAVYCMPFFINPSAAAKSYCSTRDIEVLLRLIKYAYAHTRSVPRAGVEIRHAWYIEHLSPLGSCSEFALIDALTPKKKEPVDQPSASWQDYVVPTALPNELQSKVQPLRDLMTE